MGDETNPGKEEVKTDPEPGSTDPAPKGNPDQGEKTPETTPEGDKTEPPTEEAGKTTEPSKEEQDLKKRYDGTQKSLKEKSEQYERAVNAQATLVRDNPESLDTLAKTDKDLADQVSEKIHGKSYDEYKSTKKIEKMRDTNPEAANREERLLNLEKKERSRIENAKSGFLDDKGIKNNKFDPDYQKFDAQLKVLNKDFVESDLQRALEIAYNLAFPQGYSKEDVEKAKKDAILASQTNKSGGGMSAEPTGKPSAMSPEAKSFNENFKKATTPV